MSIAAVDVRAERLAHAHAVLGKAEAKVAGVAPVRSAPHLTREPGGSAVLPVPTPLTLLFPRGGILPGSSIGIDGNARSSLTFGLAGAAMGEDSWCVIVGMPHVGAGALEGLGVDPARTALVPELGPRAAYTLSALIDGLDVVVLGADLPLAPALWRSLTTRARAHGTVIMQVGAVTPGTSRDLNLASEHHAWIGISRGSGRVRARRIGVGASGRGVLPGTSVSIELPSVQGSLRALPVRPRTPRPAETAPSRHSHLSLLKKAG